MIRLFAICLFACTLSLAVSAEPVKESYTYGPDSLRVDGVPQGKITEGVWKSTVFPGTIRQYWVYVPAQYAGTVPAAVMIFQDGHTYLGEKGDFRVPVVFDNFIHQGVMPITIGIFLNPGHKSDKLPEKPGWAGNPNNRSFEYDTLSNQYANFLIEEILPEVAKTYKLTNDPRNRAICGISSGGICAFTAAWEKPDVFGKVVSHIGSFTNIRGGHACEALIRKTPAKPIRIFLQDGANDLDNAHGNWPLANQQMAKSLAFMKYDYQFVYGEGAHNGKHGGAIMPETMKWLWRDWKDYAGK